MPESMLARCEVILTAGRLYRMHKRADAVACDGAGDAGIFLPLGLCEETWNDT